MGAKDLWDAAMGTCDFGDDVENTLDKMTKLVYSKDYQEIAMKIYEDNQAAMDNLSGLTMREWSAEQYWNSGMFNGYIMKIILDNAPAPKNEARLFTFAPF